MIYNNYFMFLHYPKTAGKSLTRFFLEVWERPVAGVISKGQFSELAGLDLAGVSLDEGRGHENFHESVAILQQKGIDVHALRAIFACIRNPYDLMVSNYFFMRRTYERNREKPNFQRAATLPFEEYCAHMSMVSPAQWLLYDGELLPSMRIVRFEQLGEDLGRYSDEFGFPMTTIPHINATAHDHYLTYITERSEQEIYRQFRWMFDNGYYERHVFSSERKSAD